MQAVVIHAPHDLRVETWAEPKAPRPGEVRISVARGGICGSDLHYYHHGGFGAVRLREPMALGHEVAGVVAEIGAGVAGLSVGDKVAVNPSMPCDDCRYCRSGMRNQCENMRFFGSAMRFPHQQGLFRQDVTLPAAQLIRLRPETDLGLAACAEPFAVCLHAVRHAGALTGARVLVSGAGPIGCLTALAAARAGAREVIVTDLNDAPLAVARRLGAHRTINVAAEPDAMAALSAGKGALDCVFECSGAGAALASAFAVLRPAGLLVLVGLGADVTLPLGQAVTKEIRMTGTFRFDAEFALAAGLIDSGAVDLSPLITATLPAAAAVEAFDHASDRTRSMKVQLDFTTV
jgi:L-idonate 5-dehydrogenase